MLRCDFHFSFLSQGPRKDINEAWSIVPVDSFPTPFHASPLPTRSSSDMEPQTFVQPSTMSSLTEWSYRHIRDVFEAPTLEESLHAISNTFAPNVEAYLNGSRLGYEGIIQLVTAMRGGSKKGLQVHWKQAMDVPRESTNRVSRRFSLS